MDTKTLDLFDALKRKHAVSKPFPKVEEVFFKLKFNDNGAYIRTVTRIGKRINPDPKFYNGATREVLKSILAIEQHNTFRVNWERPTDEIYLADHQYLLWALSQCDHFVDEKLNPIPLAEGNARLILRITENAKGGLSCNPMLTHKGLPIDDITFINEKFVFAAGKIFSLKSSFENFKQLDLFRAVILKNDLENYLSLLFSNFEHIGLHYHDYRVTSGKIKPVQPTLVIEQITPDDALVLQVTGSLPNVTPQFLESFEIVRTATVNSLEKVITVCEVQYQSLLPHFKKIESLLKKHRKKITGDAGYALDEASFIIEKELANAFIYAELPDLMAEFVVLGSEKLKRAFKVKQVRPRLELALSHGINFLEGDVSLSIEGQSIPLFEALSLYRTHSYIPLNDGTHAIINPEYINRLNRLFKKKNKKVSLSFFDLPIVEEMIDEKVAQQVFSQSREIFLGFNDIAKSRPAYPEVRATLRSYQKQGFKWMRYLHQHRLGGCLADDMGLGKTLQAITLLASVYLSSKKPAGKPCSLIVMPRSLLFNWENEIQRFKPELTCGTYYGPNRNLQTMHAKHVILTTYAVLRNDIEMFQQEQFYYVILDESQNIKNLTSQTSKAVMLLNATHRLALSGTPIENNLGDLYALFRFLNPSMFGSLKEFTRNYALPIQKEDDKEALYELQKKIYPFILRRLKQDVLKELPPKVEQTLFVDMDNEQKLLYESRRRFYYETVKSQINLNGIRNSQFIILQALNELRQIASIPETQSDTGIFSPKREILIEHLLDVLANNHKALVFANYLAALDGIAEDLEKARIKYLKMTGATHNRQELIEHFQEDDQCKVFLLTLKTGGIGLNLTAADYIFLFDPWWNRAAENQAIDRTHRIGQDKTVFAYRMIVKGTIEEKILKLQEQKGALFDSLIAKDGAAIKSLDESEVEYVLGESQ